MQVSFSKPQKQLGVQMIRIKLPFGRINPEQLRTVAKISSKYSNGVLHTTTRQDLQLHYVESNKVAELWEELERNGVDGKETFGNTVRNITASPKAGIDPDEAFDVSPYAEAVDHSFRSSELNNDLGRKVKIAFSSNEKDSAYTFMNDIGFVPVVQNGKKGFRVLIGGGMAGQSMRAKFAVAFLPVDELILFIEAVLRVFAQQGELLNRNKGRLKFLVEHMGIDHFMEHVDLEKKIIGKRPYTIDNRKTSHDKVPVNFSPENIDSKRFQTWKETNTFKQSQKGFVGVNIRLKKGDLDATRALILADIVKKYAANDIRVTSNQGIQLKYVYHQDLQGIYVELDSCGLALPGFNSTADITACPGTDTCNLGIANTTVLATEIEKLIETEFDHLVYNHDLKIKISGCMNACGHHTVASIGLQATTMKHCGNIVPAMQILLGGGVQENGQSFMAEKLIVVPTKQVPTAISILLNDFDVNAYDGEYFNDYYRRQEKMYFFQLLLEISSTFNDEELADWDSNDRFVLNRPRKFEQNVDLTVQLLQEIKDKKNLISECIDYELFEDALYHGYAVYVRTAKILLLKNDIQCNTQMKVLEEFESHFRDMLPKTLYNFKSYVLSYKTMVPDSDQSREYLMNASELNKLLLNSAEVALNN